MLITKDVFVSKRIFITGSTTGLGLLTGELLLKAGHQVIFHARNKSSQMNPNYSYIVGDLSQMDGIEAVANQANKHAHFDAIIHNAGVYTASPEEIFHVNVLAPYLLSTLIQRPERLIYLSSDMHLSGKMNLDYKTCTYSDSKLFVLMLAKRFAHNWEEVFINAVNPGWVPTRMGGPSAPDDLIKGVETQIWLATNDEPEALVSGKYFHHKIEQKTNPISDSTEDQMRLVEYINEYIERRK